MKDNELYEWAKVNLLPHENIETRLRFAEGEEGYDDDYIRERYIAQSNILIAEFMGLEEHKGSYYRQLYNSGDWIPDVELEFHTSWDWLMPVTQRCYIFNNEEGFNAFPYLCDLDITTTYDAVVNFIKAYNYER
jgi:hypothetical protein